MTQKKTKSLVLIGVLLLFCNLAYGQVLKVRSTSLSYKYKINDYSWSEWSDPTETSVLIVLDEDIDRITIYSAKKQIYDITENDGKTTDSDGDEIWSFLCVNEDGLDCRVRLVRLNSQNGRLQLYVDFNDMNWVYNVYTLD